MTQKICIKENIDSSLDSGKMMISILGAMAEIERDNISVQTMAARREKARQGGWNGGIAPYGYTLKDGNLIVLPEEAEQIRMIFKKYVGTNYGFAGVAKWMNEHGYEKKVTTHNSPKVFTETFIDDVINYPTYYAYACRSSLHVNGIKCGFGQISCNKIDKEMYGTISKIVNKDNFGSIMSELVNEQISTTETEQELDTALKAHRQALGLQRKIESELDKLDVTDKHYDRKYESLSRRLDDAFNAIEATEKKVADCEARLESIRQLY